MAKQPAISMPAWISRIAEYRSLIAPMAFVGALVVIVVPLPTIVIDLLITANITLAALVLLTTIYVRRPLDFSVFPSLLLGTTLARLVLNIATTRLIIGADAAQPEDAHLVAGKVIQQFAEFVASGDIVVGVIIFSILIVVQFVVITKGSTRISEVAARFVLDGMPGKQMAIDADLNAGLINEEEARTRREEISQEADFYGAMDGAAKFVRGDAIAGIIITLVNIIGGFAVGVLQRGWSPVESLSAFTRLTIGDGLVSQLPAFVISIAAGLIVTRSSGRQDLGTELTTQLTTRTAALGITAGFLGVLAMTGLPAVPMLTVGAAMAAMAWRSYKNEKAAVEQAQAKSEAAPKKPTEEPVEQLLTVDTLELEVGYTLVKLIDTNEGGHLLDRITMIRRQLAGELGMVMPPVRIRDNIQVQPHDYNIKIRGNTVATGTVYPDKYLAIDGSGGGAEQLPGIVTREPAFGMEAVWIDAGQKERAESLRYDVIDATGVLSTHLVEVVKTHAHELLTREETNNLLNQLKEKSPNLHAEVLGGESPSIKPGEVQRVLQNLLKERVSIRDLEAIIETLGDWVGRTRDLDVLTEYVRNALRRTICNQYVEIPDDDLGMGHSAPRLYCVSIDPALEDLISGYIDRSAEGTTMTMPPAVANRVTTAVLRELQRLMAARHQPVVLASPQVRAQVRRLIEPHLPNVAVLGYNEVSKGVEVESLGLVQDASTPQAPRQPQPAGA